LLNKILLKKIIPVILFFFLIFLFTVSSLSYAEEENINENSSEDKKGDFFIRFWNLNNNIDTYITGDLGSTVNMQQSMGAFEIGSDYWFGFITQEQLYRLGPFFGIGFSLTYGRLLVIDPDLIAEGGLEHSSYWLNFDFLKIPVLKNADMKNYLALTGNYISYNNNAIPFLGSSTSHPFSGLGVGLEGQYNVFDIATIFGKTIYIPFANTYPFPSAYGTNSELGLKWFISPKTALSVSYKLNYYAANTDMQATLNQVVNPTDTATSPSPAPSSQPQTQPVTKNLHIDIRDLVHGLVIGGVYYF